MKSRQRDAMSRECVRTEREPVGDVGGRKPGKAGSEYCTNDMGPAWGAENGLIEREPRCSKGVGCTC